MRPKKIIAIKRIRKLFVPMIGKQLDQWKIGAPRIDFSSAWTKQQLATLGVQSFTEQLARQSGIECQVQRRNEQAHIVVDMCPFCLNRYATCQVWLGVIDGLLAWLHGPDSESAVLQINELASTGHSITIDVL
jgi:hypothetical protein